MRSFTSAFFGLALAVSALAVSNAPASAIELQSATAAQVEKSATPVEFSRRCIRWRHFCRERHPGTRFKFRACLALHGCAG
jgi:hypothetical protein